MKPISLNSTLGDLYDSPVGHDVVEKILLTLGIPKKAVDNPVVRRMNIGRLTKAGTLAKYFGKDFDPEFVEKLLALINSEKDEPGDPHCRIEPAWWKEAVFYQIYPRSFCDSNGDGIGDLPGIISKLDYLRDLGVNALWLSPIYDSPNDDNGYDIRDYRKIMEEFGTMEDFDRLSAGIHERGMRLIMDLVVNHTSDEHEWFQKALKDPKSKYRRYYFLKPDDGLEVPNNWLSFFSGSAWNYYPEEDVWGLHLFSKKQMDLNWDNPDVRADVIDMIRFWLEKGVDGFRMDVINYIAKAPGLPDGDETIGAMVNFTGIEHYFYGPHLHEYLREIREKAFDPYGAFSVGETPGFGMKMSQLTTGADRHELDMVFAFDHLETPGHVRYDDYKYDLNYYRDFIVDWMENYGNQCWMSLFYNNHDNPRMVSKVDSAAEKDPVLRRRIETLLAVMQFTLKGTPFVYQGDEMGLTNYPFESMDELSDVEVHGFYDVFRQTMEPEEAFAKALCGTRDHARVLLPWNEFPEDYPERMRQKADPVIEEIYRELIALRKSSAALLYGNFKLLDGRKDHFTYMRRSRREIFVIDCNLSAEPVKTKFRGTDLGYKRVFGYTFCEGNDPCVETAGSYGGKSGGETEGSQGNKAVEKTNAGAASPEENDEALPIMGGRRPAEIAGRLLREYAGRGKSDELELKPYEARIWKKEIAE